MHRRSLFLALCFSLACLTLIGSAQAFQIERWNNLTQVLLDSLINKTEPVLFQLYNSTCDANCTLQLESIQKESSELLKLEPKLSLIVANCEHFQEVLTELDVYSQSAIFVYYRGLPLRVDNNDLVEDEHTPNFLQTLKTTLGHKLVNLASPTGFQPSDNSTLKFVFYGNDSNTFYNEVEVASKALGQVIYYSDDKAVLSLIGAKRANYLYAHDSEKNSTIQMKAAPYLHNVEVFIHSMHLPIPAPFDEHEVENVFARGGSVIFVSSPKPAVINKITKAFVALEDIVRNGFEVVLLDNLEDKAQEEFFKYCTKDGSTRESLLCIVTSRRGDTRRYIYSESEFTEKDIAEFLINFNTGKLKPYVRSEKLSQTSDSDVIKAYTSKSVNKFFTPKNANDTAVRMLFLTQDDCISCLEVSDLLEVAAANQPADQMIFGKINVSKNEVSGLESVAVPGIVAYQMDDDLTDPLVLDENISAETLKELIDKALAQRIEVQAELAKEQLEAKPDL